MMNLDQRKGINRKYALWITIPFLLIISVIPITQAFIDIKIDEEDKPIAFSLFDKAPTEKNLRSYEKQLEETSYVEQKIRPFFQYLRYVLMGGLGEKAASGKKDWLFYQPGIRYLRMPDIREDKTKNDPLATIVDFRDQLQKKNIELLVMPIPGKASIHPEYLIGSSYRGLNVNQYTKRFIDELLKKGIATLDLTSRFKTYLAHQPKERLYLKTDTHWNGKGIKLAAQLVANTIKKKSWYRPGDQALYISQSLHLKRFGDIPLMTKIPKSQKLFKKEDLIVTQIFDTKKELYQDAEEAKDAPILIVGDSFMRIFQTDEPESAGFIANLAHQLNLPLQSIVNDGGASTLARQALARDIEILKHKKLVIYAFAERDLRFGLKGWQKIDLKLN